MRTHIDQEYQVKRASSPLVESVQVILNGANLRRDRFEPPLIRSNCAILPAPFGRIAFVQTPALSKLCKPSNLLQPSSEQVPSIADRQRGECDRDGNQTHQQVPGDF